MKYSAKYFAIQKHCHPETGKKNHPIYIKIYIYIYKYIYKYKYIK